MSHVNIWEKAGLYRRFLGIVSGHEVLLSNVELQTDARFPHINYVINDFSDINGHDMRAEDIQAFANSDEVAALRKPNLRIALVLADDEYIDLAQLYCEQMSNNSFDCEIFYDMYDARTWANHEDKTNVPVVDTVQTVPQAS